MSKIFKRVVLAVAGLFVVSVLGYGIYSYATHTGYFAPVETPVIEEVEVEISDGE